MKAIDLIQNDVPPIKIEESIEKALNWMDEFKVNHLPVIIIAFTSRASMGSSTSVQSFSSPFFTTSQSSLRSRPGALCPSRPATVQRMHIG